MYKLIYTVPFTNVDGEALTVQILEDGGTGSPVELTGGTPPFVVDVNDEDFLYTPTRFSGATLKLVGSDYLQKLFSTQYQKFKVNLVKAGSVIWTGFITPELYSQDYDNSLFEMNIECISALSTLEYIDFKVDDSTISLLSIINKCITESKGDFRAVYIPNTYTSSLNGITVSTANFIDEDGKAMTLKECLEEVCKFLNWTVTEYEGIVYFIDMDYINAGKNSYTNILTNTSATLSSIINLQDIPSKGNNNQLSILGGYNKAIVIDSDYEVDADDLFPKITFDELKYNSTIIADKSGRKGDNTYYLSGYYKSNNFNTYQYSVANNNWTNTASYNFNQAGTHIVKATSYLINDKPLDLNWTNMFEVKMYDGTNKGKLLDDSITGGAEQRGEEAMKLINGDYNRFIKPLFTNEKKIGNVFFSSDSYLGIKFSTCLVPDLKNDNFRGIPYELNNKEDTPYEFVKALWTLGKIKESDIPKMYFLPIEVKIGNKYYNGSQWTTTKSYCKIPLEMNKDTHIEGKWLNPKNTNNFELGVPDLGECYTIKLDSSLYGSLEVTCYIPVYLAREKTFIYVKNFTVDCCRVNKGVEKREKKDTKYENIVNEGFINELDDIVFKITSKNDSELSFSKAIESNTILDVLSNNIYNNNEKPEKLLIQRIINQYKQPKIKLVQVIKPDILPYSIVTDRYLSGKQFVFTGGRINYEDNYIECNLIELN